MTKHLRGLALMTALTAVFPGTARAQQRGTPPAAAAAESAAPLTPLKVQVVISRFQGDKKLSSLPYVLAVNANDRTRSSVHNGIQVLIPMVSSEGKTVGPVYKDVGTNIECTATTIDAGRFRLDLTLEDSSVYTDDQAAANNTRVSTPPWLRAFRSSQALLLKDGQTTQYTTATDKTNGEVVKVDVTLTVVK